ncbi:phage baseplate assembly protein V [Thiotrichales bacterium 19X7-9]|nr:phage baseplate assembly protein V [Thiotrichales bacterium 19X7-9]
MTELERIGELERRLSNLIRVGTVSQIDPIKARVRIKAGNILTTWLKWMTQRSGDCQTWWSPSLGEQVLVLSPSGELNNGIVLPSIYTSNQPSSDLALDKKVYSDGTTISYSYADNKLTINCIGSINIFAATSVNVTTNEVTLKANSIYADCPITTITGNVLVQGSLTYQSGLYGSNAKGGSTASIEGSIHVTSGDVTADNISLKNHAHRGDSGGTTSKPI